MKHTHIQIRILLAGLLAAVCSGAPVTLAATEVYTSRAAFEARVADINGQGAASLPLEIQSFDEVVVGGDAATDTGPGSFTYRDVPMAVAADGFGVFTESAALGYQANGGSGAPLVIETAAPVNALGFDVIGFGSRNIDPFFICFPPDYELQFSGGDLVNFVIDTEVASGNGDSSNTQFFGIVDLDSPFTQVEISNTGFFIGSLCGFSGTEPDVGDTILINDLAFAVAAFEPECGDVDGNSLVNGDDVTALRNALAGVSTLAAPDNCSVAAGADDCNILDAVVLARNADLPGALPGVADVCRSNNPVPAGFALNLIGYWPFDESDPDAINHSPRGLRVNALASGDAARANGKVGAGALDLPDVATNGYVEVSDPLGQDKLVPGQELTLASWLNPAGPGASPVLGGTVLSKAGEYELFRLPGGNLRWQRAFGTGPADVEFGVTTFVVPQGEWTHVAVTFDASEAKFYANGTLEQSWLLGASDFSDNVPANNLLRIGSSATAAGRQYHGLIDEPAVWTRALAAADIEYLYDRGFGRRANEIRVVAANLDVASGSVWSVTQTGAAPFTVTTDSVNLGDVKPMLNGDALYAEAGILIPTIRETRDGPSTNLRLAEAFADGTDAQVISITDLVGGTGNEVNARVSLAYFPFAQGWIGGRVLGNGTQNFSSGGATVVRNAVGIYTISIPGVTDARAEGMLIAVGNTNGGDNVLATNPLGAAYQVVSYDNDANFGTGQDVPFSYVYIPYDAPNLTAAEIDQLQAEINGTASSFVTAITTGVTEITIPGEHYRRGMLLLGSGFTPSTAQDNLYTYAPGGGGRFVVHSRDLPDEGLQNAQYSYAYVSFDRPATPD